jgi:hypothetical protein
MAYDQELADRIRGLIGYRPDVAEKKMFGGIAFLIAGKPHLPFITYAQPAATY